jgi:hypothetical protein
MKTEWTPTQVLATIILAFIIGGLGSLADLQHDAVIRVYDEADNMIDTYQHKDDFKEP